MTSTSYTVRVAYFTCLYFFRDTFVARHKTTAERLAAADVPVNQ